MKNFCFFSFIFVILLTINACGNNHNLCVEQCHEEHPSYSKSRCENICDVTNEDYPDEEVTDSWYDAPAKEGSAPADVPVDEAPEDEAPARRF